MSSRPGAAPARSVRTVMRWAAVLVPVAAVSVVFGVFALLDVIDGSGGEAGHEPWLADVLHDWPGALTLFVGVPLVVAVAATWTARRRRSPVALSLLVGPLAAAGYLYAVVVLGTGLGPFDVGP